MMRNKHFILILSILLLYYGISGIYAAFNLKNTDLVETDGRIIALHEKAGNKGATFHPTVTFLDNSGSEITFISKAGSNFYKNKVGKTVRVVYPSGFPQEAYIKGSNISPAVLFLSGTALFIIWSAEAFKNTKKEDDSSEK